jgi:hypothetical protein
MTIIRNIASVDQRPWRWRDERGYVGFDPDSPQDSRHLAAVDVGKVLALGKLYGGRPDALPDRDQVVEAVADLMTPFFPPNLLRASETPADVMSSGAKWTGNIGQVLKTALANLAPGLDYNGIERDAVRKLQADAIAGRGPGEEDPDELQEDGKRMSSGKRFTGDGFGARFLDAAARSTRNSIAKMQAANLKYRAARSNAVTADARTPPSVSVAAPTSKSMRDWISSINANNRLWTQNKREQQERILNPNERGR